MKRITTLSMLGALLLAMTGCSGADETTDTSSDELSEQSGGDPAAVGDTYRATAHPTTETNDPNEGVGSAATTPPQTQAAFRE
jgi:hypothetical protein